MGSLAGEIKDSCETEPLGEAKHMASDAPHLDFLTAESTLACTVFLDWASLMSVACAVAAITAVTVEVRRLPQ